MTSTQRIKTQKELELLQHRKAKADALGPEVIAAQRQLYDNICTRIRALQDDLAIDDGGAVADLLLVVRATLDLEWKPGAISALLKANGTMAARLQAAENELIASFNQGQGSRYQEALDAYRGVLAEINEAAHAHGQMNFDDWEEIHDENCPF